jgi:N utilization substance protein B
MADVASLGPGRREARERAIGLLYESEARELTVEVLLEEQPLTPANYVVAVLEGVESRRDEIDALINSHAEGWTVDRLPNVDRAILRLAIWELVAQLDVPAAVVMDEAVELAKEYSTERSSSFVNGVLDSVARQVRPD